MLHVVADMKCDEKQTSRLYGPRTLAEYMLELRWLEMDYRVERHSAGERSIAKVQRRHVADFEFNAGSQRSRDADHLWRKIDPDDIGASVMQILCDLSRSAAEVGNYSLLPHFLGEAIQEMTVEWFSVQL